MHVSGRARSFFSDGICVRIHPSFPSLLSLSVGAALLLMPEPTVNQSEGGSPLEWMNSRNLSSPCRIATSFSGELDVALSARDSANEREKIELRGEREGR